MPKTALIIDISGQDGARRLSTPNFWQLQYLDIFEKVNLIPADLVDAGSMVE